MVRLNPSFCLPVAFFLWVAALSADPPRPLLDAAPDVYTPVPMDQQRLAGAFGGRLRANTEGFLEHVSPATLLAPFRHRAVDTQTELNGESAGIFLIAASNAYEYSDDFQLKAIMDEVAKGLMSSQEPDGYLGLYTGHARWGSGDALAQACNLAGLFAYGRVTGNDDAFDAGHHAADLMISVFDSHPETSFGPESLALIQPMAELYRSTGDSRYLAFSKHLLEQHSALNVPSGLGILLGFGQVELYRLTGADADLKRAQAIWQNVAQSVSIAGAPQLAMRSSGGATPDTLAQFFWLEFNVDLLHVTGGAPYAEAIETLLYNQLLASQNARTGDVNPETSLDASVHYTRSTDAYSLAEAAAITQIPDEIWGRFGGGLGVLTYSPGRATLRLRRRASVQLYMESSFPESGNILLHVEPTHDTRFPLALYVPSWAKQFTAEIGGMRMAGNAGHFLTLTREWKKGDTVKITVDLTAAVIPDPLRSGRVAIRRGPQLLALSKTLNPQLTNDRAIAVSPAAATHLKIVDTASVMPVSAAGTPTYTLLAGSAGEDQDLILTPFADAESNRIWFTAPQ